MEFFLGGGANNTFLGGQLRLYARVSYKMIPVCLLDFWRGRKNIRGWGKCLWSILCTVILTKFTAVVLPGS